MRFTKPFSQLLITASLTAASAGSYAASATSSFDVGIQVLATCSISATNMTFGSITTGTTSNNDATSALTVNCSNGTTYTIALDNGNNYFSGRRLSGNGNHINYQLYSDSGRSTQWNSTITKTGVGSGGDQSHTIFGRIPSGQAVAQTGSYADIVTATVSY